MNNVERIVAIKEKVEVMNTLSKEVVKLVKEIALAEMIAETHLTPQDKEMFAFKQIVLAKTGHEAVEVTTIMNQLLNKSDAELIQEAKDNGTSIKNLTVELMTNMMMEVLSRGNRS